MEHEFSLIIVQVFDTSPCPEPDHSSPCSFPYLLKINFNIILPSTPGFSKTHYVQRNFRAYVVVSIAILFLYM